MEVINPHFSPYCRGQFAAIEGIIHTTRIREFLSRGMVDEANRLIKMVEHYRKLTWRVSPNSEYARIMDEMMAKIEAWRRA